MESINKPLSILSVTVFVTFVLASCGGANDDAATNDVGAAEEIRGTVIDSASQAAESAAEITEETAELVRESSAKVADKAGEVVEDTKEVIEEAVEDTREVISEAASTAKKAVENKIAVPTVSETPEVSVELPEMETDKILN
jgi:gas vesicle protein